MLLMLRNSDKVVLPPAPAASFPGKAAAEADGCVCPPDPPRRQYLCKIPERQLVLTNVGPDVNKTRREKLTLTRQGHPSSSVNKIAHMTKSTPKRSTGKQHILCRTLGVRNGHVSKQAFKRLARKAGGVLQMSEGGVQRLSFERDLKGCKDAFLLQG